VLQAIVRKGHVQPQEVPAPSVSNGRLLIKVVNSCISAGTESSSVAASGKTLIRRAIEQPENIKKAISMVADKGATAVYSKLKGKLDEAKPTGYSISGVVVSVGAGVTSLKEGDFVAAAGADYAFHAEFVEVPENLVVPMPTGLDFPKASTVALGAISMQGVRRADLKIGEHSIIIGAGLIGLLALQMLKTSGVRTAVIDLDERRLKIAKSLGAELAINPTECDAVGLVNSWSEGFGADAVLFCAATNSNDPLSQAFNMCRRKGKVVLVGVSGMDVKREDIYPKELDFLISTSYGPGRYDRTYEENGIDYPYAYVRWTEKRNMHEYLRLIAAGNIALDSILEKVFPIEQVSEAFDTLANGDPKPLGVILDYGNKDFAAIQSETTCPKYSSAAIATKNGPIKVAIVGCGGFARSMHLPNMKTLKDKFHLHAVMDKAGHIAKEIGSQYGASYSTTSFEQILKDNLVELVVITTRHDSHALFALQALQAGKNVFVEKPLAITSDQLRTIQNFYEQNNTGEIPVLMVGFNRRFSAYAQEIKRITSQRTSPLFIHYRMNAGYAPLESWLHEHGGRIVGEACHIIDLMRFFIGSEVKEYACACIESKSSKFSSSDNKSILLEYEDGSIAAIEYFALGSKFLPKEYMEMHFDEKTIILDDYNSLKGYGLKLKNIAGRGKGHLEELLRLHETLRGKNNNWPIPLIEMISTTQIALDLAAGAKKKDAVKQVAS
jgi:predicted dehydrogenase/threonine dehydrogenase-like Zn-dependent dehydrogenase